LTSALQAVFFVFVISCSDLMAISTWQSFD